MLIFSYFRWRMILCWPSICRPIFFTHFLFPAWVCWLLLVRFTNLLGTRMVNVCHGRPIHIFDSFTELFNWIQLHSWTSIRFHWTVFRASILFLPRLLFGCLFCFLGWLCGSTDSYLLTHFHSGRQQPPRQKVDRIFLLSWPQTETSSIFFVSFQTTRKRNRIHHFHFIHCPFLSAFKLGASKSLSPTDEPMSEHLGQLIFCQKDWRHPV